MFDSPGKDLPLRFRISCATRAAWYRAPARLYVGLKPLSLSLSFGLRCLPSTRMTSSNGCKSPRENQVALISGTRGAAGVALTQCSLKVFIGESSLRVIDHRTARRYRGQSAHLVDRFLRRKDYSRPIGSVRSARARNSLGAFMKSFPKREALVRARMREDKLRDFANAKYYK